MNAANMRKIIKVSWFLFCLLVILGFDLSPAVSAGSKKAQISYQAPWRVIRLDPRVQQRYVPPPAAFSLKAEQLVTADIQVNYIGSSWTPEVTAAFEFAVSIWESLITSPVTIEVDADFAPLGPTVLGGAGPIAVAMDFDNAPQSSTWYPIATANKLADIDLDPFNADIQASFSSTFSAWDFGTDGSTDGDKISFASVVLHELGHGLGFLGSMQAGSACSGPPGRGCFGIDGFPMIYDRYTENGAGTALLDFPNNSTDLYAQLTSNNLFFDSPGGNFANGGSRVPIYAPATWSPGSSYSHLAESFNGTPHAMMTYSIAFGETVHHPGAVTLCMFKEMGWTVSETCSAGPDTPISGLSAGNDGPTLLGEATQLSASILSGSNVTYAWDFGDQTGGSGAAASHTYGSPGEYTAEVTATNSVSQVTATTVVLVEEAITGLAAANDGPTMVGEATQLSATVTSGSNVIFAWDFGDETIASEAVVSHIYSAPGFYIAEVTATNDVSEQKAETIVEVIGEFQFAFLPLIEKP